ncbi:MAG TPA: hypothetical protein DCP32_02165 [Anaerolineaceae bacterium]|nr:hypothetical protein [Anaerolineaceae bacterium]HBA91496.1 hypothetical protein [Anaerolineaceae bacterium]
MPALSNSGGRMQWIFLSPHLDDAALSCGGLIAERTRKGDPVEIWTICAGDPPPGPLPAFAQSLHKRWGTRRAAAATRRLEDQQSCQRLGAVARHFAIPDCIYRRIPLTGNPLISTNEDLFQPFPDSQRSLVDSLRDQLANALPLKAQIVCPLALGNHIDHQLVRRVAEQLDRPLLYYADYPYTVQASNDLAQSIHPDWQTFTQAISPSGLRAWQAAVAAHSSQISTFWDSVSEMEVAIQSYYEAGGGCKLWRDRNAKTITNL